MIYLRNKRPSRTATAALILGTALFVAGCGSDSDSGSNGEEGIERLEIWTVFPAGSGNYQTATVVQEALEQEGLVDRVEIVVHEGGNGTTGISDLVTRSPENTLLVAGFGEVGATIIGDAPRTLVDAAPVGRILGDIGAIVVPADSEYETLEDLYAAIAEDPGAVPIAVGNRGGVDDIFVANIARELDIPPADLNRVVFSGGGELMVSLLGGQVAAGSSGYGEVVDQVTAGELRILALSSADPIPADPTAPNLTDLGFPDAATVNWRGLYAGPNVSDAHREALIEVIGQMVETETWKDLSEQNGWQENYLPGDEFAEFLDSEYTRTREVMQELGLA